MATKCCIPGYDEAILSESLDRAFAFIGLPEFIAGQPVNQMTPMGMEWLKAVNNPYVSGGFTNVATAIQFIWILSPEFSECKKKCERFTKKLLKLNLDYDEICEDIDAYLDRVFLDAPEGKPSLPYYSSMAGLIHAMASEPYYWSMEKTQFTPLRVIFQLLKVKAKCDGATVVNKRSHKIKGDWLAQINDALANGSLTPDDLEKLNG